MGIFDRFRNVKKPQLTTDEAGLALALFARTENAETVAKSVSTNQDQTLSFVRKCFSFDASQP